MASVAAPARTRRAPRPHHRPVARPADPRRRGRPAAHPRVAGGIAWILVVAALLAGIVALNVAVLGLNQEAEKLEARAQKLAAKRDALASELSTAAAAGRIQALAVEKLGLARPAETTYVRLGRAKK
jgi:cell division protein FtsL